MGTIEIRPGVTLTQYEKAIEEVKARSLLRPISLLLLELKNLIEQVLDAHFYNSESYDLFDLLMVNVTNPIGTPDIQIEIWDKVNNCPFDPSDD